MRILLDTSFLLPSLGIKVTGAAEALENLEGNDFSYSKFSILECAISLKESLKFLSFNAELKKFVRKRGFEDVFLTI